MAATDGPHIASTHCAEAAYSQKAGQAELASLVRFIQRRSTDQPNK